MKQPEIKRAIANGRVIQTPYIKFYRYTPPQDTAPVRPAVVVSKKISPSSVVRHKYQRWMRELIKGLSPPPGDHYVLVAKSPIKEVDSLKKLTLSVGNKDKQKIVT